MCIKIIAKCKILLWLEKSNKREREKGMNLFTWKTIQKSFNFAFMLLIKMLKSIFKQSNIVTKEHKKANNALC